MKQRVLSFLAIVSLILAVLTAAAGLFTYITPQGIWADKVDASPSQVQRRLIGLASQHGKIEFEAIEAVIDPTLMPGAAADFFRRKIGHCILGRADNLRKGRTSGNWLGFGFSYDNGAHTRHILVVVPHWFLVGALALLPAIMGFLGPRRRERQRMLQGLCGTCGYDLRATPDRCPECGHSPGPVPPPLGIGEMAATFWNAADGGVASAVLFVAGFTFFSAPLLGDKTEGASALLYWALGVVVIGIGLWRLFKHRPVR